MKVLLKCRAKPMFTCLLLSLIFAPACEKKKKKYSSPPAETPADANEHEDINPQKPDDKTSDSAPSGQKPPEEKPTEEKPVDKPVEEIPVGRELIGHWATPCIPAGGLSYINAWNFRADGEWTYHSATYSGKECQAETETRVIAGSYGVGKRLANGPVELDLGFDGITVLWLVYKLNANVLTLSAMCDDEDVKDSKDSYCYGRSGPVGDSVDRRSLDPSNLEFIKQ